MIRRSLRIGIRLGMLGGLAFALFKIAQARRPLPAAPPGDDPWGPSPAPVPPRAPAPVSAPATASDEPPLVQPTMLQTTSLRRPRPEGDRSYNPAATAPPVVRPASPFAPTGSPTPAPAPPAATEIEPDDDELVILTTGDTTTPTKKAPAKKAPAKKARAEKAPKKAAARKATAKKAPASAKKAASARAAAWVEPVGGVCPTTHPVKAKLRSAIFHLPGMAAYARTTPDRCYRDEDAATGDGLRKAAR